LPETDLDLLTAAARDAGRIALQYHRNDPAVTEKPDGAGPVSEADLAVNAALESALRTARPGYGWLSEESTDSAARLQTDRQFIVDPIDGTRAFIDGSGDWAHALAIVEAGTVIAGAVYLPVHDLMFAAVRGEGATLNGARLSATDPPLEAATLLATKANFAPRFWKDGKAPPVKRKFRSSLAYRMCLTAQGRYDAMLTLRPSWEWDIAAGALIAAEAGAQVTDQHQAALRFNNAHPQVPGVVAAGPALHQALIAGLATPVT